MQDAGSGMRGAGCEWGEQKIPTTPNSELGTGVTAVKPAFTVMPDHRSRNLAY